MPARLLLVSMFCVLARAAGAQSAIAADTLSALAPGARIRIAAPGIVAGQYVGVVRERSAGLLTVTGRSTTVMVPVARVTSVQVSRGKSRLDGAERGVVWGAALGLLTGLISRTAYGACDGRCGTGNEFGYPDRGFGVVASSTASVGAVGAVVGAMIGRERWEAVRESADAR